MLNIPIFLCLSEARPKFLEKLYFIYQKPYFWRYLSHLHNFLESYFLQRFNFCRSSEPDSRNLNVLFKKIMNKTKAGHSRKVREIFY